VDGRGEGWLTMTFIFFCKIAKLLVLRKRELNKYYRDLKHLKYWLSFFSIINLKKDNTLITFAAMNRPTRPSFVLYLLK